MRLRTMVVSLACLGLMACGGGSDDATTGTAADDGTAAAPPAAEVALIERTVLFGNPERASGQISPDGRWLGYLAPVDGVLNVWVAPADNPGDARAVTSDTLRGIRMFGFTHATDQLVYLQDEGGDENFHLFVVDLASGEERNLTPFPGARAMPAGTSRHHPDEVLVSVNNRNPQFFDLHRVNLRTGEMTLVYENDEFAGFVTDGDFNVRFASRATADGGMQYYRATDEGWVEDIRVDQVDAMTTSLAGFDDSGRTLYLLDSRDRDTSALFALDTDSGEARLVHADDRADVSGVQLHPVTGEVQAASVNYRRVEWTFMDADMQRDMERLRSLGDGQVSIASRTSDDRRWVVLLTRADASARYYLFDRDSGETTEWFDTRPALAGLPLQPMHDVVIRSRDGLDLVSYYTLPRGADPAGTGRAATPSPMVLFVHGGPWARDSYGFHSYHQLFANRGYAVLSVNFRGSTGFGKSFVNAGDLQWGRAMHDDLIDAVEWAIEEGITTREQVAIMGGSYGGYATLAGLTMTPEVFACGVDIVGPSNLVTLLESIPPYWAPMRAMFASRVGDLDTEEGRALLVERSPLTHVDNIQRPLLIGQGANDPRVVQAESDQIVEAMQARDIPVIYALYPDEGHGFARPANSLSFTAITEAFLGECLGGRVQPVGDDFQGASLQIPAGLDVLPADVRTALEARD